MDIYVISLIVIFIMMLILHWQKKVFWSLLFADVFLFMTLIESLNFINQINIENDFFSMAILLGFYVLIPLLVIIGSIFLVRNTRIMYLKEGRSLVAKLSAGFGLNIFVILGVLLFMLQFDLFSKNIYLAIIVESFLLIDVFFVSLFICYLIYSVINQMLPYKKHVDYIIVLGAGIRSEEVTPLLKSRLDKGLMYLKDNPQVKFVVSGGKGPDEPVSEAFAMAKYLRSQNIPDNQIIIEDQSTTTYENMKYSKIKIDDDWSDEKRKPNVLFTTNNYHVLRSMTYADMAKLKAHGAGAPTSYYFLPSALLREYAAVLVQNKIKIILIMLLIISFVIIVSWPF
ncbi:YdcF family protein [Weissella paramesenteroides]|nr:YdcF family protein [Weissella sagaensis]KAA8432263.1 YdcF family protein [Weissella paramesenteroides]MBU7568575.1 YdcF family protein [Weissella hellenica]KAA8439469.1 YdcF family protein [Weissella paramesenteroides]QDJ58432.1 YdcF family protein [Weissella hellenica]UEG66538.1 YdcF family protein [Weissella hellenica]